MMGLPYIAKRNGISDAAFGYSQTFFGIVQIIGGPIFGFIMNKFGIKFGLYVCYFMTAGMVGTLIAFNNIYGLFISRIFGFLIHGMQGHQAMIAAVTAPGKERTTAFGKVGVCFGISFVIAPIINKVAGLFFHDSASLFSAMILSFVGVYVAHKYVNDDEFASYKDDNKENKEESKVSFQKVIKIAKEPNVLTVFLQKNIAVAPMHIPFAVMQLLVHAQFSYFVYFYQLYFILPFLAIGMTLVNTVSDSILTASVEQNEQAIILGICTAFASFFRTLAPSLGGLIMDKYGFSLIGYIGVACALFSLSVGFLFPIKNQNALNNTTLTPMQTTAITIAKPTTQIGKIPLKADRVDDGIVEFVGEVKFLPNEKSSGGLGNVDGIIGGS
uniref:Major facilitator superfamily (MFS) profile domain-containing protein n=1 Tax=Panagrolaimus sp. ES5 TaxID=591445 RepID=A0AC34FL73_9BILA